MRSAVLDADLLGLFQLPAMHGRMQDVLHLSA